MKIRLLSDLHIEGYDFTYTPQGEDILVLAGDIHTRSQHYQVLNQIPSDIKVILVAGNHEYYDGVYEDVNRDLFDLQNTYPNLFWLNNNSIKLDGVNFYGGTMRTDMELYGIHERWFATEFAKKGIADFHVCTKANGFRWTVEDHIADHQLFCDNLQRWLKITEGEKRVVVSHFVPTPKCTDPRFEGSMLNPYFISDMDRYMGWEGLWLFGHTHSSWDLTVGDTRLVCNPRGYGSENKSNYRDDLILEI